MTEENIHVGPCRTLFIRNLPYTTCNEELEESFSDIGPTKQCFVVKDKDSGKCKGYGYVTFSMVEDAIKAKDVVTSVKGRRIGISFADKSRKIKRKRQKKSESDEPEEEKPQEDRLGPETSSSKLPSSRDKADGLNPNADAKKYLRARTVVLTGFPDDTELNKIETIFLKNIKHVVRVIYPIENRKEPTAHLRFKCIRDALRAIRRINSMNIKGVKLKAVQQKGDVRDIPAKILKQSRLIVRNLSFKCSEENLKEAFKRFGNLTEVKIPLKENGLKYGFGFVQFTNVKEANNAILGMNTKEILGRPVAVDWSLPRKVYERTDTKTDERKSSEQSQSDESDSDESSEESTQSGSESESESDSNNDTDSESNDSDSEDSSQDDGDSSDSDMNVPKKLKNIKKNPKQKSGYSRTDVDEKRTLFIRGVPFSSMDEDLEETFSEFGELEYARIVMDTNTERSKGTAFVRFKTKESASQCIGEAESTKKGGGLRMGGRSLTVTYAIRREEVTENLMKEKTKEKKDARNLWLAREGMIRAGTKEAEGLSKSDLVKRAKIEALKRQKLKNQNIFISPTRLCVRNIPPTVDETHLRQIFLKAAGDKTAQLTECRIMRDMDRLNSKGVGKSRGYAFIDFSEHRFSLSALKNTNNSPEIFGDNKRPIVEFSLENKVALNAKKRRMEKMKETQTLKKLKEEKGVSKFEKKSFRQKGKKTETVDKSYEVAKQSYTGPKGLPKHFGPKVRHKPRQAQNFTRTKKIKKIPDRPSKGEKRKANSGMTKEISYALGFISSPLGESLRGK